MDKDIPSNYINIINELGGKDKLNSRQEQRLSDALLWEKLTCDLQYEDD